MDVSRRIVILGKTGVGKSSLANTIFGEPVFQTDDSAYSGTKECQTESRTVNGKSITWIDTPGFFNTEREEEEMKPVIVKCITECAPGPHVFLIVLNVGKFTNREKAVIETIQRYFSDEALKYATVVFTHGDQLPEGMDINQFVTKSQGLSDLVQRCGGRCNVVDNRFWKRNQQDEYRTNKFQVEQLLNTFDKIFEANKGGYYTTEMLQAVNKETQQECIKQSGAGVPPGEILPKAKTAVYQKLLHQASGVTTGALLGAAAGVPPDEILPKSKMVVYKELLSSVVTTSTVLGAFLGGGLLLSSIPVHTAGLLLGVAIGTTGGIAAGADATKGEKAEAPKASKTEEHQEQ